MTDDEDPRIWEHREYGSHSPETTPHYREQMGAEAVDELKKIIANKDTYGVYIVGVTRKSSRTAGYVWAGPSESPLHLLSIASDFQRMAHDGMKNELLESAQGDPHLMTLLKLMDLLPEETEDDE